MNVDNYCVYEHVFPNGKKYIGISKDPETRWNNGYGYSTQPKVYRAIKKYGWENVKHNILIDGISCEQAKMLERSLIRSMDTMRNGYNQTLGGDGRNQSYLSKRVSQFIREVKRRNDKEVYEQSYAYFCWLSREDKECADFINKAADAVEFKHGKLSPTDEWQLDQFWYYMMGYFCLNRGLVEGRDQRKWHEPIYERYRAEYFIYGRKPGMMDWFWDS